ncbi:hypothetical protein L2755_17660 [Shewanella abyssi]|uniref:hypothetical protein n=1 Tax=Shewanella abyssi TaxID=311789 RepID=UPI00200EF261|nr:hypothetical protein [Shewanella abyssi]MCL1051440.1 hypothetical protein [Shewanella abyssi]
MQIKLLIVAITGLAASTMVNAGPQEDETCWYEDQQVQVTTIECEYEAALEYYGTPNYNVPPQTSCPTWAIRNVSLEKDIGKVETKIGVGYLPSCGSKWISHDWNGSHTVEGRTCDYWWREGENVIGYEDSRTVHTETRRVRVCENLH